MGGCAGGGRFSCTTSDVLSCIMHVISRGCARRSDDNPHIVEFLPEDPPTPQKGHAQFSFSPADTKDSTHSLADLRCDLSPLRGPALFQVLFTSNPDPADTFRI